MEHESARISWFIFDENPISKTNKAYFLDTKSISDAGRVETLTTAYFAEEDDER
jgi:hypothetical protein